MSVRESLLAILDQGACYGYQLRAEFHRRTGSTWPLNVGQVYNTLDRLERDGLVARAGADEQGHVFYEITDAGRARVGAWLASPLPRGRGTERDDLAVKIAMAATLPGVDVAAVIRVQRAASESALQALRGARDGADRPPDVTDLATTLVRDALAYRAEAELRWLDHVDELLRRSPSEARRGIPLGTTAPKRGRPAKSPALALEDARGTR